MKLIAPMLLVLTSALLSMPGLARDPARITVPVAGIDLVSPKGTAELDARIGRAIRQACHDGASAGALARVRFASCRSELAAAAAVQRDLLVARARASRPHLAQLY